MNSYVVNFRLVKKPSAFIPLMMSAAALALVVTFLAVFGVVRGGDEGGAAHSWQLLMVLQVPVAAFFAIKWLPREPKPALHVLALQAIAWLAAAAPVYVLGL